MKRLILGILCFCSLSLSAAPAPVDFKRTEDVIYGRKFGTALTLDVFQPPQSNRAAVLFMVSGGFYSSHSAINPGFYQPFLKRGYTVFAVVHGSQPKFTIPEIVEDIHRAVRFIRHNATNYGVDPDRFAIMGASAGGHLSLTMATQGTNGAPSARDPIDRQSSAVQAAACFFPPTDFLNWGKEGVDAVGVGPLEKFQPAFGPRSETAESRRIYGREISPINFIHENMPPILIVHGDADRLVPIQQATIFADKCRMANTTCKVITREGKDHGWPEMREDLELLADWFDEHLRVK